VSAIRDARAEDLPAIAALAARTWRASYPGIISAAQIDYMLARMYDLAVLERELHEEGIRFACLEEDGALVAFASFGPCGQVTSAGGRAKLHKLYVDPAHQRRGHGRRLLAHVEAAARAAGVARLVLNVNKRNAGALAAYRACGFDVAADDVQEIGGGFVMDDWIMEKPLHRAGPPAYEGGCHCGRVRFRVTAALAPVVVCNCSMCTKKGYLHLIVPPSAFQLLRGEEALAVYEFNTGIAKHKFCRHCGVQSFYVPRSDPDKIDVNVRCLEGVDIGALSVVPFDGRHWEEAIATERTW
jgi:ribosomal protein S18 acetylase RimI-like enzyme